MFKYAYITQKLSPTQLFNLHTQSHVHFILQIIKGIFKAGLTDFYLGGNLLKL